MSRRPLYAYYYPAYHRTTSGWFEWDLVRNALPWFEGHQKPDVPLWGYADDAGPATFVRQARAAAAAGLDGFVFDLWWRPDGATLYQEVLDQAVMPSLAAGALPAGFRFGIMWCPVWPRLALPMGMDQPSTAQGTDRHFPFTAADLLALFDHLRPYLTHPNALRVEGRPLLSFFHAWRLRTALGDELPEALRALRARAREAGLPGLYLVGNVNQASDAALLEGAGLDALSAYVWGPEWQGPYRQDFATLAAARRADWAALARRIAPQPFLPAVTTGWDATPRGKRDWDKQRPGFPWSPIIEGNTPQAVASAVRGALDFLDARGAPADHPAFVTSWNEWSESHRLEPCERWGYGYLEELAKIRGLDFKQGFESEAEERSAAAEPAESLALPVHKRCE